MERRLQALAQATARIFAARTLDDALRHTTEAARDVVGAHQAVTSVTTDGSWAQAIVSVSLSDKYAAWRGFEGKPSGKGIYTLVCQHNRPMRLSQAELEAHPAFQRFGAVAGRHPPMRGWLAAPLVGRDGANLGLIQLSDKNAGEFDAADESVIVQLAGLAALAIENQRLIDATQAAERRFEAFAQISSNVLWENGPDHRYTLFLAKQSFRMNAAPEAYLGKTRWEAARADASSPLWVQHIADVEAHRPIRNFEYPVVARGTTHYLRVSADPMFDADGTFLGYRGATHDVTELRRAEAATKASEERFRQFAGIASDWLWETDAEHRFTFFAGAAGTLDHRPYGITRWELVGADLTDPKWRAHLEDLEARRAFRDFEYTRTDAAGRTRYIAISGEPVRAPNGAFLGYRGTATDLTARREAEAAARKAAEQYRTIVETANEGVWILDAEARTTFANRRMAEMMGYAVEEMVGRSVYDFRAKEDGPPSDQRWRQRSQGIAEQRELQFTRRDGTKFWALLNAQPMFDAAGKFAGSLGMVSDITARKEAEAALRAGEDRFRDFAEVGSDWLWETDAEHRVTFLNGPRAPARGFGIGKRRWEIGDIDAEAPEWRAHREDLENHCPFRKFEYSAIGHEGETRHFSLSGNPVFDAKGAFLGYRGTTTDITALREAEKKARASEERFKDFARVSSDWMWEADDQHRFTYFSPSRDSSQPDSSNAAIGKTRWEFAVGDLSEPKWQAHLADLAARRPFRAFEYQYRRPDGSAGTYVVSGVPVFAEDGTFRGYRGTTSDITAQRAAEAAARESEREYRRIVEMAHEGIWMLDSERRTTYVNPRMAEMLGYAPHEMQGRNHWDFMAEEDRAQAVQDAQQRPNGVVERMELRYMRKDGAPIWVIVTSNVIDDPATGTQAVLGMVTDITDRKKAEEALRAAEAAVHESEHKYRSIVETANEGIWTLDAERRTTYVNPRMADMLGYSPAEMHGRHHWDFMAPADRALAIEATRQRPVDGMEREEVRYLRKDGGEIWVLVTSSIIDDPTTRTLSVLGMVTDITARRRAEQAAAVSEARFRDFAEVAADWMWETDADHRLIFKSGAPLAVGEAPIGSTRWALAGTDSDDPAWRAQVAAMEERRPFRDCEFTVKGEDGRIHHLVSSGRPVFDAEGIFTGYRGTTADRTVQREAEAAAAASEKQFRQFVETANEGVWMIDTELRTTYANNRIAELLGYTVEEVVGRPFLDFKHERDHAESLALWNERKHIGLERIETRLKKRDGSSLWVLLSATPRFDTEGRLAGSFMMLVDVTARKAAQKAAEHAKREVETFLASTSDGVSAFDNEWRYTYLNPPGERICGFRAADVIGRNGFEQFGPSQNDIFLETYKQAKRDGAPVSFSAYSSVFKAWHEIRAFPSADGITVYFRDITAERAAHLALAASERKFRRVVETANEGVWMTDRDAKILFANRRLEEILGYEPGELVGKSIYDTIPADRIEEVRAHRGERIAGRMGRFEACHKRKDGSEVTMLLSTTPLFNDEGAFTGSFVMFVDISEQRRIRAALAESESKLRAALENNESILESISDGFVALDNDWRFTFINPAAERMWNLKAGDLIGRTAFDAMKIDESNPFIANYIASKQSGEPAAFAAYSEGFGKWLEVRGYPHPGGYTIFFDDVTDERRQHRALLTSQKSLEAAREMNERIFDTSLDLICITDRNGNFLQVNPGACQQFGYAKEQLVGHNASEFIDEEGIVATRSAMREARTSQSLHTFENKCRRHDGTWVPMNWSVAWSEREQKFYLIGRDMSERIAAQERLNRSQRLEAIGQLTGGIAHDFNNLLTVIMGNSDSLARGLADRENLRRRAELSLEAARRAAELTAQLLSFARRQTLAPKAVEANKLVADMHELMRRSLGAEIEIGIVPGKALWLCKVDSTQLETALLNLALNARDAMPGGGRLTIATENRTVAAGSQSGAGDLTTGDYVAISAADTGTGMAPEVMARAFEPFFTTKDIGKGSGLGLAMVYGFVKQSGGSVAIESEPGRGTKVTLYLPRAQEAAAAPGAPAVRDGAQLPGGSETILVVEDDPAVRELVTDQLKALGYRVLVAGNGPTARNILYGGEKVDLLFTDVKMPGGITGTELAAEAEMQLPNLRILFTTGYAEVPALKNSRRGVALLRKPYKTRELARTVRATLDAAA